MNSNMIYIDKICCSNCLTQDNQMFERAVWYIKMDAHRVDFDL